MAVDEQSTPVQDLAATVESHEAVVVVVRELMELLRTNDDAWFTMLNMLRTANVSGSRHLLRFVASNVGRTLSKEDSRADYIP